MAEILKSEGDAVEEDETIAQIETDKVTIDIKSPTAGKVAELRVRSTDLLWSSVHQAEEDLKAASLATLQVKVEDTVTVGQIVAVLLEVKLGVKVPILLLCSCRICWERSSSLDDRQTALAAEKPKRLGSAARSPLTLRVRVSRRKRMPARLPPEEGSSGEQPPAARKPMIQFPKRMTDDGKRISSLSGRGTATVSRHHHTCSSTPRLKTSIQTMRSSILPILAHRELQHPTSQPSIHTVAC